MNNSVAVQSIEMIKIKKDILISQNIENKLFINEENLDIYEFIRKFSKKHTKLFSYSKNKIITSLKINGSWRIIDEEELLVAFSLKNKEKINNLNKNFPNMHFFNELNKENSELKYENTKLIKLENFNIDKYIKWFFSEEFYKEFENIMKNNGYFNYDEKKILLESESFFEEFKRRILSGESIKGINYLSGQEINGNLLLRTAKGNFHILKNGNEISIVSTSFDKNDYVQIKKFSNGIIFNIESNINKITTKSSKMSRKQKIQTIFGIALFILLSYITFNFIISTDNIELAFIFAFSKESLKLPWIYFIIISFLFSFFMMFLIAAFMEKFVLKKDKLEWSRLWIYFLSSILRRLASFLTGNYFISLFVWGWYINRKLEIRVIPLVSSVGSLTIYRGILYSIIGGLLIIIGTSAYFLKYDPVIQGNVIAVLIMSWTGFAWEIIHNFGIFFMFTSATFYLFITNIYYKFIATKKLNKKTIDNIYQNNILIRRNKINKKWLSDKNKFKRATLLICVPIVIEGIETILYFNMIDQITLIRNGNQEDFKIYWDFISISGLRLMATNIHNFPLINILPGKGMGFSEFGLTTLYETIFIFKHGGVNVWGDLNASDMSEMTSFMTRFFNQYLQMALVLIISTVVLSKEFIFRKIKN